jgi:Na+-transporting NADH:ubiquinone oxidoreductase subunit NqrE
MKHLIALSVVVLVFFAIYLTICIDSQFWYGEDLSSTIFALFIGVIATLTIILTLKMIYEKKHK